MRIGYADPPYPGCCGLYGHHHPDGLCWDDATTHERLIRDTLATFDGWVLHTSSTGLGVLVPHLPAGARIAAWVKPFASFKPNVVPAYAWEPVIMMPLRRPDWAPTGDGQVCRDWIAEGITLERGLTGAKPAAVVRWALDCIGATRDDDLVDLYPGTGAVGRAWQEWRQRDVLEQLQIQEYPA